MSKGNSKKFGSRWGFILAAVGSAVGMANVWGFPNKMVSNGGGAFLVAYLIFIALFSTIGLAAEYAIGRRARTGTLGAYKNAWKTRGQVPAKIGEATGWLPLLGSLCIALGYAVIVAYVLQGLWSSITGELLRVDPGTWFGSFSGKDFSVIPFHVIVVVGTLLTLLLGAKSIEKTNKIMMPVFFIIFLILAVRVAFLPGAAEGYKFIFNPEWSKLEDPMVWVSAMGQAFFSLSVTGSGMIVYGAYLSDEEPVVPLAIRTAIFDTIAALVAALVIVPAFKSDIMTATDASMAGPGLLFVTLPAILKGIPFGQVFAIILYTAMVFAGISSLQNMFEAVAESVQRKIPKLSRWIVLAALGAVCLGVGLYMEPISKWGPWMDLVSIYIIPIGATLGAISWFWVMKKKDLMMEINKGGKRTLGIGWHSIGRYIYVPCAIILCLVALCLKIAF